MKIRCELHLGPDVARVILVAKPEEKPDHLAMKLAAFAMFLPESPIVEPSSDHMALRDIDFKPDVITLDEGGEIRTWVECGAVTINKLDKISRRFPNARLIVLKTSLRDAERLRRELDGEIRHAAKIEIWTWPDGFFQQWLGAMEEKTEIFGEVSERSFNAVVNRTAIAVDLVSV